MAEIVPICCTQKSMFKGDHRTFLLTVKDQNGVVVDITGATIIFSLKADPTNATALVEKISTDINEIEITNPTQGEAEIYLIPADTSDLEPGIYFYDVELTTTSGKVYTLVKGELNLLQDVTN